MTLHNTGGQPGPTRPVSPVASRRSRQGLTLIGVIAAVALSFHLLNGGVATSQNSGGTPEASPMASPVASPQADDPRITIEFTELNDSGVTGTATLFASGDETIVELDLEGTGEDHPAHIHEGTCDDIEPEPEYNLENVGEEGASTSLVDAPLDELIDGDYVIDLHLAANQLGTLIVCAEIEGQPTNASGTPVAVGGQGDPTAVATATAIATTEPVTPAPTATVAPTSSLAPTATLAPTAAPTAAPVETPAPTSAPAQAPAPTSAPAQAPAPTLAPTQVATAAPESTPDDADALDGIGGLISDITSIDGDGTQGSSSMLDSGKGLTATTSSGTGGATTGTGDRTQGGLTTQSGKGGATTGTGDGTQGGSTTQSGKGGASTTTTITTTTSLPTSTGSGSSLLFQQTPYEAAVTASGVFSVILLGAAMMLRRGETQYAASRWRRLGL